MNRLTYKKHKIEIAKNRKQFEKDVEIICDKLGQLEDILDKYGFETTEDLDNFLDSCKRRIECEKSKIN